MERIEGLFFDILLNELKGVGETQAVHASIEAKSFEITIIERVHGLENSPLMNMVIEDNVKVVLQSLQEVSDVQITEIVVPNNRVEVLLTVGVNTAPHSEGSFSVAEQNVQETDNSLLFFLLLPFFLGNAVSLMGDAVLDIIAEEVLQATRCDFCLNDLLKPRLLDMTEDEAKMTDVETVLVDQFGKFFGAGEVDLLVFDSTNQCSNFLFNKLKHVLCLDLFLSIPKNNIFQLLILNQLRTQNAVRAIGELSILDW